MIKRIFTWQRLLFIFACIIATFILLVKVPEKFRETHFIFTHIAFTIIILLELFYYSVCFKLARNSYQEVRTFFYFIVLSGVAHIAKLIIITILARPDGIPPFSNLLIHALFFADLAYHTILLIILLYFIKKALVSKNFIRSYAISIPIILVTLGLISLVLYRHYHLTRFHCTCVENVLSMVEELLFFGGIAIVICSVKSERFLLVTFGYLVNVASDVALDYKKWIALYYPNNQVGFLDAAGTIILIFAAISLLRNTPLKLKH